MKLVSFQEYRSMNDYDQSKYLSEGPKFKLRFEQNSDKQHLL